MALASPVWKNFVFPPFRQTSEKDCGNQGGIDNPAVKKPEDNKPAVEPVEELDFADDPAEALLVLLALSVPLHTTDTSLDYSIGGRYPLCLSR
jgi:hypothetical protein